MSGTGQVRALLALRWSMIRDPRVRTGIAALGLVALGLVVLGILVGALAPLGRQTSTGLSAGELLGGQSLDRTGEVRTAIPTTLLVFALLCIVAPLTAGGGYELVPEAELVAYPVRVRTLVRASLLLSPLNVAWYLQVLLLAFATAYAVRGPGGPALPLLVVLAFLAACTTVGQALGWVLVGVRRNRHGRRASWLLLAAGVVAAGVVAVQGRTGELLEQAPTRWVLDRQDSAAALDLGGWVPATLLLVAVAFGGYLLTVAAATWALRRPGDLGVDGPLARPVVRRPAPAGVYRTLVRVDRASVWRSPPLRRGLLVLAILPVVAAMVAGLPWMSIALLPPLVASGAALLFGVNALSLDGSGALWVASLPHDPDLVLRSKLRVVAEVVGGAVLIVLVGAALRASAWPDLQDVLCVVGAALGCTALVVTTCLRLSVTRPHRADLRGPRDTPAPPGTMAVYSLRLAGTTTLVGIVFSTATYGRLWAVPVVLTALLLAWSRWSWLRTRRIWRDPVQRARVVATVSAG